MKQKTQDRLLSDAMLAADSWHKEATQNQIMAELYAGKYIGLLYRSPIFFLAGLLAGILGVLLAVQAFTV